MVHAKSFRHFRNRQPERQSGLAELRRSHPISVMTLLLWPHSVATIRVESAHRHCTVSLAGAFGSPG